MDSNPLFVQVIMTSSYWIMKPKIFSMCLTIWRFIALEVDCLTS